MDERNRVPRMELEVSVTVSWKGGDTGGHRENIFGNSIVAQVCLSTPVRVDFWELN